MTDPFWTYETSQQAFEQLRAIVPDLPETACLEWSRCSTCTRCQEAFGMVSIWHPAFDRRRDGGYHTGLLFDGIPRVLGGKAATAIGRTDQESWDNLLRALA